jgi:hypothetical protein
VAEIPKTRSAAYRIGDVPCPQCNPDGKNADKIPAELPCAWCWDEAIKIYRRFVKLTRYLEWAKEHGKEDEEIPTSPESRAALTPVPPTDPDPNAKP